jgi:Ca2+-binding EF-hand superfamily protein
MTSCATLLRVARRILVSVGPQQLNEARRIVTVDVASEAEELMKQKLHRKFSYFDDVAFGEVYAHFCSSCVRETSGGVGSVFTLSQDNSNQHSSVISPTTTFYVAPSSSRSLLSRQQQDMQSMYIDYRALDLPSFRMLMVELAPQWSKDLVGLDRLFVAFDADHNGYIDVHEFMQGIQAMCQVGTKEEKLRLLFMSYDGRGKGKLGVSDISCMLKTMYKLSGHTKVHRRAREAAATALVGMLARPQIRSMSTTATVNNINNINNTNNINSGNTMESTTIDFDEFLSLPNVQPDVLKMMSLRLPYASKRSVRKSALRAESACISTPKLLQRKPSVEEVQQIKTSPRGDQ